MNICERSTDTRYEANDDVRDSGLQEACDAGKARVLRNLLCEALARDSEAQARVE